MDGFFVIDKEKDYTSFDVCNKIKHKFFNTHVGHTGTLDPNATGVLVVAVGSACKTLPLLEDKTKEYLARIEFNRSYDTLDPCGKITSETDKDITLEEIEKALDKCSKMTMQVPPQFSALKVNGKRSYDLARKGIEVKLEARPIEIFDAKIKSDLEKNGKYYYIDIYLKVSRGFYVRSFVRDLCEALNIAGNMFELRRLSSGTFNINQAKKIDEIKESDILSVKEAFDYLDKLEVKDYLVNLILNGVVLDERQIKTDKPFIVTNKGKSIAIYAPCLENYKYKRVVLL